MSKDFCLVNRSVAARTAIFSLKSPRQTYFLGVSRQHIIILSGKFYITEYTTLCSLFFVLCNIVTAAAAAAATV